jgi:rod shape-determining protein MreC
MTTNRSRNFIVLDRGAEQGIAKDMGVITPNNELVGYVVSCSEHYCVVQPMLNTEFSTGGRLVDNNHVCVVHWPGTSKYELEAVELSVYSEPQLGMKVEVRSERLPEGVLIGTIDSFELNSAKSAYSAIITIAADMSSLDNLLIVENRHYGELQTLIEQTEHK